MRMGKKWSSGIAPNVEKASSKEKTTMIEPWPTRVNVMGHTFLVKEMDSHEAKDNDGYCLHSLQEIHIAPNLHHDWAWETLAHEMVEAYNGIVEADMDHQQITLLANFIFQGFGGLSW